MKKLTPRTKQILNRILEFSMRIIALASSVVVLFGFLAALLIVNFNVFTPWLLGEIAERFEGNFSFDSIELGWHESFPTLEIHNLLVKRNFDSDWLEFSAESAELRLAQPFFSNEGWQIAYVGVVKPRLLGQRSLVQEKDKPVAVQKRGASVLIWSYLPSLLRIHQISIQEGEYDVVLKSDKFDVNALGQFNVESGHGDNANSITGSLVTTLHNESEVKFRFDLTDSIDDMNTVGLHINAKSVDAAWLALISGGLLKEGNFDFANVTTVIDADINGLWRAGSLESVDWVVEAQDLELDGTISNSKETLVTSTGSWRLNPDESSHVETTFELASLDFVALLKQHPGVFPPRFHNYVSERLYSLWVSRAAGSFSGDPIQLIKLDRMDNLLVEGDFENLSLKYGKKWPPLFDGEGTFEFRARRFDAILAEGTIHEQPLEHTLVYVEDFTLPDPLLTVNTQLPAPMPLVFVLFGPEGTVNPGKTEGIVSGSGTSEISLVIEIPLKRGKEFSLNGTVTPVDDVSVVTFLGPQVTDIEGKVYFNRAGLTTGELSGEFLGGTIKANFKESGPLGNVVITGSVIGNSDVQDLEPIIGAALTSRLSGFFPWNVDFEVWPEKKSIVFTTSFVGVESQLPFPMQKEAESEMRLRSIIRAIGQTERRFEFEMDKRIGGQVQSLISGNLLAKRKNRVWGIDSGVLGVGNANPPKKDESGVLIAIDFPIIDIEEWVNLIRQNEGTSELGFANLKSVQAKFDKVWLAGKRELNGVDLSVEKLAEYWGVTINSDELNGQATYRNSDFLREGETPLIVIQLSKCHLDASQTGPSERSIDPRVLPAMEITCSDTKYGQYDVGESKIIATPTEDSWNITSANFNSQTFNVTATANWKYSNSSVIDFNFNSVNFGQSMERLGYPGTFDGGTAKASGHLEWDDAFTKWLPELTSGSVNYSAQSGVVTSGSWTDRAGGAAQKFVGTLNYETLLNRLSVDVSDTLKSGIAFDRLGGRASIKNGIIEVQGAVLIGPSADIAVRGTTDWITKQHHLKAGVDPKIGNSLTTFATLIINPATGLLTYLGKKVFESLKIDIFPLQYEITGSWAEPDVKLVKAKLLAPSDSN